MDDTVLVGVLQRAADLPGNLERDLERKLALPCDPLAERLAFGKGHDVVEQAAGLAGVVQRKDVRVLESGGDLDLAEEPVAAERGRQLGLEHLDGDTTTVLQVLGQEDDCHAALAQGPFDAVPIAERCRELLEKIHAPPRGVRDNVPRAG
jgi:hypothetical protein